MRVGLDHCRRQRRRRHRHARRHDDTRWLLCLLFRLPSAGHDTMSRRPLAPISRRIAVVPPKQAGIDSYGRCRAESRRDDSCAGDTCRRGVDGSSKSDTFLYERLAVLYAKVMAYLSMVQMPHENRRALPILDAEQIVIVSPAPLPMIDSGCRFITCRRHNAPTVAAWRFSRAN